MNKENELSIPSPKEFLALLKEEQDRVLMRLAKAMQQRSYAPYSRYLVGAALVSDTGRIFTGCNVENAAFSPSICAERTAIAKAVSEGERHFVKMAITGGPQGESGVLCTPCGVCRQVLVEFCQPDFELILGEPEKLSRFTLKELMPFTFTAETLN